MSRLALTPADKQARDWFAATTCSLGCTVTVDEMGNQFAIKPGKKSGPPTMAGSHLDTQPTGGRYDGILGVTAGVEMLRVLQDRQHTTQYPVGVVNWTNEEGARFPISMLSSGVWSGAIPLSTAHTLSSVDRPDPQGTTFLSALQSIGYHASHPCSHLSTPLAAHFELHIEQGPHLVSSAQKVGAVTGVQAYRWYTITITGRDSHTGTTDLRSRSDALLAAAKMIVRAREVAWAEGGLASTGVIDARPGSVNTVPGEVVLRLDVRGAADETVRRVEDRLRSDFDSIAAGKLSPSTSAHAQHDAPPRDVVKVSWRQDSDSPAISFHPSCIDCVTAATRDVLGPGADKLSRRMVSGAGHDSVYTSRRVPTSMIFVPCRDGVSHNPAEFCEEEDCAVGVEVLLNAVVRYDEGRRA